MSNNVNKLKEVYSTYELEIDLSGKTNTIKLDQVFNEAFESDRDRESLYIRPFFRV